MGNTVDAPGFSTPTVKLPGTDQYVELAPGTELAGRDSGRLQPNLVAVAQGSVVVRNLSTKEDRIVGAHHSIFVPAPKRKR